MFYHSRITNAVDNVLHHPVARPLLFLFYSPSHMQTCVTILKSEFLKFYSYFHTTVALHDSTDMVIIVCFEISVDNSFTRHDKKNLRSP
jgi:hypothetical protein